jgi:AcrR family transcriptional regulator
MTTEILTVPTQDAGERDESQRIIDVAIQQFGQHGFDVEPSAIAEAAGTSAERVNGLFGAAEGLRNACDEHILETIRTAKSEALQSMSPATWFAELAAIESYAPMMAYLVRSMLYGGALGRALMRQMINNAGMYDAFLAREAAD